MAVWEEREEDLEAQLNRGALWAVTYGDLMSYLVIFFMLMYAASATKSVTMQMSLKNVEQQFGKQGKLLTELFSKHGVQQIAKLELGTNRIRIVFNSPILFDSGSAILKESSLPHLQGLAEALKEIPNPIHIEGHTDNQALGPHSPFASNWELSAARAFAVLRCFEKNGIPSGRLAAIGYGEFRPIRPNDTQENMSANRRIEVNIIRREE